jgi:hypothetical protein
MTRALGRLIQGDLAGALTFHPLVLLVALLGIAGSFWAIGRRLRQWPPLSARMVTWGTALLAAAFFGVWLLRMAAGTLPQV